MPQGPPGPSGAVTTVTQVSGTFSVAAYTNVGNAMCPPGTSVVGGGFNLLVRRLGVTVQRSSVDTLTNAWTVILLATSGVSVSEMTVYASCIN